jgi:hypothetical protein
MSCFCHTQNLFLILPLGAVPDISYQIVIIHVYVRLTNHISSHRESALTISQGYNVVLGSIH